MATPYSTQLVNAAYLAPHPLAVVYTVPASSLIVITSVDVWLFNNAANQTSFVEIGNGILLYRTSAAAEVINQTWTGKQVLTAAQTIQFQSQGANARLAITGYLLRPV